MGVTRHNQLFNKKASPEVSKRVEELSKTRTPRLAVDTPICLKKDLSRARKAWTNSAKWWTGEVDRALAIEKKARSLATSARSLATVIRHLDEVHFGGVALAALAGIATEAESGALAASALSFATAIRHPIRMAVIAELEALASKASSGIVTEAESGALAASALSLGTKLRSFATQNPSTVPAGELAKFVQDAENLQPTEEITPTDLFIGKRVVSEAASTLMNFVSAGLVPVFVFDGEAPPEKQVCYDRRLPEKARYEKRYKDNIEKLKQCRREDKGPPQFVTEECRKVFNYRYRLPKSFSDDYKTVLKAYGAIVIDAPCEADPYCVFLEKKGVVDAIYSTDSDILVHGGKYRFSRIDEGVHDQGDGKFRISHSLVGFELEKVLTILELTFQQYKDVCCLAGTDYNTNVRGYGIGSALRDIKKLKTIEAVLAAKFKDKDVDCLRHKTVLRMFSVTDTDELGPPPNIVHEFNLSAYREWGKDYLLGQGLDPDTATGNFTVIEALVAAV